MAGRGLESEAGARRQGNHRITTASPLLTYPHHTPPHTTANTTATATTTTTAATTSPTSSFNQNAELRKATPKRMVKPMELFLKAGPEGTEIGDCPFAHYVRMVLHAKGVEYVATPCVEETKPKWLVDGYGEQWGGCCRRGYVVIDVAAAVLPVHRPPPPPPPPPAWRLHRRCGFIVAITPPVDPISTSTTYQAGPCRRFCMMAR